MAKNSRDFVRASAVSFSHQGNTFLTGSYDHTVSLWSSTSSKPLITMNHGSPVEAVALLPGDGIAVSAGLSSIKLWSLTDGGRFLQEVVVHHKTISSLCVSKDGKYLFSSSLDHSVKVLQLEDFSVVHQFKFKSAVMSICVSVNSQLL